MERTEIIEELAAAAVQYSGADFPEATDPECCDRCRDQTRLAEAISAYESYVAQPS